MALTEFQKQTFDGLIKFNTDYKYTPSVRVLASELGRKGHQSTNKALQELFEMGLIEKNEKRFYQPKEGK